MKKLTIFTLLSLCSTFSFAGGEPITVGELTGKWKIARYTSSGGDVISLGDSAYYIFTKDGDFIEEMDGMQLKRHYFVEDSKLMIKGPVLSFEWDVLSKGDGRLTLKTSQDEQIELKK